MKEKENMQILLVEDERDMAKIVKMYLKQEGYIVSTVYDGNSAYEMLCKYPFDLAILDWMLPGMDGVALCKEIRELKLPMKIIMLTAKGSLENEITGLHSGADDYIRKPFEPQILLLRIQKLFALDRQLYCGTLILNPQTQTVSLLEVNLRLTKTEYKILLLLIQNQGVIFSREILLDRIWGMDYMGDIRTVDTHIRRLRGKIGETMIVTHVGLGYSMEKPM